MSGVARIGPQPSLLDLEREAFRQHAIARQLGSIEAMKRAVDVWRVYERALAAAHPPKPKGAA